jgi:hypothetical protein
MILDSVPGSGSPEIPMNDGFETLEWAGVYGKRNATTTGLTWGYYGGRWSGFSVSTSTLMLTDAATNYLVVTRATGVISVSTASTNWDDVANYARVYKITTVSGAVTAVEDHRAGLYGVHRGDPLTAQPMAWNAQTDSYTLALSDAENGVEIDKATAVNLTVPPNSSVAFPIGTSILIAQAGAGQITVVAGAGVTLRIQGLLTAKLLGQYSIATVIKRATDTWILSGDLEAA